MAIFAIDPGTTESAYLLLLENMDVYFRGIAANDDVLKVLQAEWPLHPQDVIAIEMVACYGMPVGRETFETCLWIGRFAQAVHPHPVQLITRNEVKMALCHTIKGVNDAALRQRLIDIYGPGKDKAVGTKAHPGTLYGIKSHMWSALAVAMAVYVKRCKEAEDGRTTQGQDL